MMTAEAVRNKIIDIIVKELEFSIKDNIKEDTLLIDIGFDSIAMMSLLVYIEEGFGFEVGDEFIIESKELTFGDIFYYVLSKLNIPK